jgi:hypothetical protein
MSLVFVAKSPFWTVIFLILIFSLFLSVWLMVFQSCLSFQWTNFCFSLILYVILLVFIYVCTDLCYFFLSINLGVGIFILVCLRGWGVSFGHYLRSFWSIFTFFFLVVLGGWTQGLYLLDWSSTTWWTPPSLLTGFKPWRTYGLIPCLGLPVYHQGHLAYP